MHNNDDDDDDDLPQRPAVMDMSVWFIHRLLMSVRFLMFTCKERKMYI